MPRIAPLPTARSGWPARLRAALMAGLVAALSVIAVAAAAQTLPAPQSDTVSDYAGLLAPEARQSLVDRLDAARAETGVQIVAVAMDRIANQGATENERIEDYAKRLFNAWGVGDATRNDGVMILVEREGRRVRVALGAGYDPVWDGAAQRVIDGAMLPLLREGRTADALEAGVEAAVEQIARPFAAGQPAPAAPRPKSALASLLIPLAMVAVFFGAVFRRRIGDGLAVLRTCPQCGRRGLARDRIVETAPTATTPGLRLVRTHCRHCPWHSENRETIPERDPNRRGNRGDGGGFGGGRSSGGGASGRW